MKSYCFGIFLSACLSTSLLNAQNRNVQIVKAPAWVQNVEFNFNATPDAGQETGFYCLLIDQQESIPHQEAYTHIAYRILTAEGVQTMSDLTFDFDPAYQTLKLHSVRIHRAGQVIDKMPTSIQTVQREQSMERYLYDGSLTAFVNITDVRVGDIIEYSFTKKGYNPVYEGHVGRKIYFTFAFAYDQLFERIIAPASLSLDLDYRNADLKPEIKTTTAGKEYVWSIKRMNAFVPDDNVPFWYDGNQYVMVTNYDSWAEVASWASRHFQVNAAERVGLQERMKGKFEMDDKRRFTLDAIRFVQDEVRYLGFDGGLNSHKPHSPLKVFDQRFGDCKDKSLLLCAMLATADIEAHPVLVNSLIMGHVKKESPSISAFNHCVVQVKLDGEVFYIDPTINNQGGNLQNTAFPSYGQGLIIDEESDGLEDLFSRAASEITEAQTIAIPHLEGEAYLQVTTIYKGGEADFMRSQFLNNTAESIQKNYLTYYSSVYADIEALSLISHHDNRRENIFTVEENYRIPEFWKTSPTDEDVKVSEMYPQSLSNYFTVTKSSQRKAPYALTYPVSYHHTLNIKVPQEWGVQPDEKYIDNDYYHYEYYVRQPGDKDITVETHYRTKQDHIPVNEVAQFVSDHEEMYNNLTFQLSFNKNIVGNEEGVSWLGVVTAMIALGIGMWTMLRLYYFYDPKPVANLFDGGQPLGGWLILVAIGVVLSPLRIAIDLFNAPEMYDRQMWANLIALKFYGYFAFVLFAHLYSVIILTYAVLILILFIKRRSSLPKLITIFYAANAVMVVTASVVGVSMDPSMTEAPGYYRDITSAVLAAAIWIPYFNMSSRVKETFVNRINDDDDDFGHATDGVNSEDSGYMRIGNR